MVNPSTFTQKSTESNTIGPHGTPHNLCPRFNEQLSFLDELTFSPVKQRPLNNNYTTSPNNSGWRGVNN